MVACSGGLDSTVLIHAISHLQLNATILHVNYHLRDEESDLDQAFVSELGENLGFSVQIEDCPKSLLYGNGINLQQAARSFRRKFFDAWTAKSDQHVVLLAHHSDDQVETFFTQLARGAGIFGLGGMLVEKGQIIRPFLSIPKSTLEEFAKKEGISWREDRSNKSANYLRNRFRNVFLPALERENPDLRKSVLILQAAFRQEQEIILSSIQDLLNDWEEEQQILLDKWKALSFEQKLAFTKVAGFEKWIIDRIDAAEHLEMSSKIEFGFSSLIKVKNALKQVDPRQPKKLWEFKIESIEFLPKSFSKDEIFLDPTKLNGKLQLRMATKEDYIHPVGMKGKQQVFKILKDSGIPSQERKHVQILCDEETTLWIPGLKISKKALANAHSSSIIQVSLR